MSRMTTGIFLAGAFSFMLAACGAPASTTSTQPTAATMVEQSTEAAMAQPTEAAMAQPTEAAMAQPTEAAMAQPTAVTATTQPTAILSEQPTVAPTVVPTSVPTAAPVSEKALPAWQTVALTDARTGETFSLADFAGKTVYVEPMATWCSNCKQQLNNVKQAKAALGDDVVFVGLSVETNIAAADLASYADANGFDWRFAVLTPESLGQLVDAFGRTIANPPSTPHFVIAPDGTVTGLNTGFVSADDLVTKLGAQ